MICFDTMVVIWGVQGKANPDQHVMIDRCRRFIDSLGKDTVMIPAPAVAEYLQDFDNEARRHQLAMLERNFFIPSFDLKAAFLAAGLAREARGAPGEGDRQAIKTDCQIIAIAIINHATQIITNDVDDFTRIARGKIQVSQVPEIHEQTALDL
jgi:predicted nucleic acid-binding protein